MANDMCQYDGVVKRFIDARGRRGAVEIRIWVLHEMNKGVRTQVND